MRGHATPPHRLCALVPYLRHHGSERNLVIEVEVAHGQRNSGHWPVHYTKYGAIRYEQP